MILNRIKQIAIPENLDNFDLIISCCGYEERCVSLLNEYKESLLCVKHKYAFVYDTPNHELISQHASIFKEIGFQLIPVKPDDSYHKRREIINEIFSNLSNKKIDRVLIDYSSMNREWYSALLLAFDDFADTNFPSIECTFYYRANQCPDTLDDKYIFSRINPLSGYSSFQIPDKPLALFIGLGSEERALTGIWQYADVEPSCVHYFYTNNEHIFNERNHYRQLFKQIPQNNKHEYDLTKCIPLFTSLCDLYKSIRNDYRVAIISCGPKPFTLISLLFAKLFNVDVWKLETNAADHVVNKSLSETRIVLQFNYIIEANTK